MSSQFRLWLCICLGNLCKDNALVQSELFKAGIHFRHLSRLNDDAPDVRAASCYALACLIGSAARSDERCRTYSSDATTTAPTTCTSIATTDRRNTLLMVNLSCYTASGVATSIWWRKCIWNAQRWRRTITDVWKHSIVFFRAVFAFTHNYRFWLLDFHCKLVRTERIRCRLRECCRLCKHF